MADEGSVQTPQPQEQPVEQPSQRQAPDAQGAQQVVEQQAQQQTGQQEVRLHVDESKMTKTYANAFRTNGTAEEVMLDFGMNVLMPAPEEEGGTAILFQVDQRIVMNYYSAKRLAMALGQLIRQYEQDYGNLELDANKRRKSG